MDNYIQYQIPSHASKIVCNTFSENAHQMFGINNAKNVFGLEDRFITPYLIEAIINRFLFLSIYEINNLIKNMWRKKFNQRRADYWNQPPNVDEDGIVWDPFLKNKYEHISSYLQNTYNFYKHEVREILANKLKISTSNFSKSSKSDKNNMLESLPERNVHIPDKLYPFPTTEYCLDFILIEKIYNYQFNNNIKGGFCIYQYGDIQFCIQATVKNKEMSLGLHIPIANFLNEYQIDKHQQAAILIFQDMRVALFIHNKLCRAGNYDDSNPPFIITSHLGTDLENFPWYLFQNRKVIFIPAPDPRSMAMAKAYDKICNEHGILSFKIANKMYLRYPAGIITDSSWELNAIEQIVFNSCNFMEDIVDLVKWCKERIETAMTIQEYEKFWQNYGVFKKPRENQSEANEPENIPALPPSAIQIMPSYPEKLEDFSFHHTFFPANYILIIAVKDAGKTHLGLAIAASVILGYHTWPWFPLAEIDSDNVCLVDGETLIDEFGEILKQHGLNEYINKRLFPLSAFADNPDLNCELSLRNEQCREKLLEYCLCHNCRYLILDNLVSLTDNRPTDCAASVLSWIKKAQEKGICVILLHHKSLTENKARSNEDYVNKARVLVELIGKNGILEMADNVPEKVAEFAKKPGLTLGLKYKCHKKASNLCGYVFWLHLPMHGSHWECLDVTGLNGESIEIPEFKQATDIKKEKALDNSKCDDLTNYSGQTLSPDESMVIDCLKKHNKVATREQIENECGWCANTTRNHLKLLIDKKLVERKGDSKSTYYELKN